MNREQVIRNLMKGLVRLGRFDFSTGRIALICCSFNLYAGDLTVIQDVADKQFYIVEDFFLYYATPPPFPEAVPEVIYKPKVLVRKKRKPNKVKKVSKSKKEVLDCYCEDGTKGNIKKW